MHQTRVFTHSVSKGNYIISLVRKGTLYILQLPENKHMNKGKKPAYETLFI